MAPSTQKLTAPYWKQTEEYVRAGGTFYCSYSAGAVPVHIGMWIPSSDGLFGCRRQVCFCTYPTQYYLAVTDDARNYAECPAKYRAIFCEPGSR